MKKKFSITIDPEMIGKLSPEVVKTGVERRARVASKIHHRQCITMVMLLISVLVSVGLFAFASPESVEPPVEYVYVNITEAGPWYLALDEIELVEQVVQTVANGEQALVKQAVAQAIRNGCEKESISVCELISKYKYPCDEKITVVESTKDAVNRILLGYTAVDTPLLFCYNPKYQDGNWHETLNFVCEVGNIRFFN